MSASSEPIRPIAADSIAAWDHTVDVVVVGGGIAGVCAGIGAAEAGAEVLVLECAAAIGGTSAMSSGLVYLGGGTSTQLACGYDDHVEDMESFLLAASGPGADTAKIHRYCVGSVDHHDWLVAHGVEFKPEFHPEPDIQPPSDAGLVYTGGEDTLVYSSIARPVPRGHHAKAPNESGWYLMEQLAGALTASGAMVRADTRVEHLVVDGGRVVGVVARSNGAQVTARARGGVILAAGGFLFNPQMVAEHVPAAARCTYPLGTDADDGTGIRLAQGVGADVANMDALECHLPFHPPRRLSAGILVNRHGRRFVNEDAYNGVIGQRALLEHDGVVFLIVDEAASEPNWLGFRPAWVAETAEELATEIDLPPTALAATLARYNRDAARGVDSEFNKQPAFLRPLIGPVGAVDLRVEVAYYASFTLGGVVTDPDGRALRRDGSAIGGLFAVGRTAAGIPARGYVSGISLGDGSFFGRRAGQVAAAAFPPDAAHSL